MKTAYTLTLTAAALLLGACAEKVQAAATQKSDDKPWAGARADFIARGWQVGDKTSWEQQLRKRSQGQNEYSRAPITP
jgi:hypothetical protein